MNNIFSVPGFGGGGSRGVPAAPPPPPKPPKKTDEAVRQARRDEKRLARIRAGQGGTVQTPVTGVGDAVTTQTLLGQ
jgi:hypothetical protein